jgi:hypothetical protein
MAVGFDNRFGSFFEVVELAKLVRNVGEDLLHSQTDRALGIRNDGMNWNRQGILDLAQQVGQVILACTLETASEQNLTRECVAQHPEHILRFVGLEAVQSKDDVTLTCKELLEAGLVSKAQSEQFFIALEQIDDGARSNGNVEVLECGVDFGKGAMLTIAQIANESNDIKAEFAMRQCPGTLFLGTNGVMVA